MDPAFFVYYDECDFAKRLADAGWHSPLRPRRRGRPPRPALHRPRRRPAPDRRIPPQPRPLHAQAPRRARRPWPCASSPPGPTPCAPSPPPSSPTSPPRVYWAHARQALFPGRGESLRDRAAQQSSSRRMRTKRLTGVRRGPRPCARPRRPRGRGRRRRPARRAGARNSATSSLGWRRRASQARSPGVKKPLARRASG